MQNDQDYIQMQLLSHFKFSFNRSRRLSMMLIHIMEISVLSLLLAKSFSGFYHQLFEITTHTGPFSSLFMLVLLIHNVVIIILGAVSLVDYLAPLRMLWSSMAIGLKLFPYLLFIPILNYCIGCVINLTDLFTRVCSMMNIVIMVGYVLFHQFLNESLKFRQIDFCNRRLVSYIEQLILVGGIVILQLFGPFYGGLFYILRSGFIVFRSLDSLQYRLVQRLQLFYSLLSSYAAIMAIMNKLQLINPAALSPVANTLFLLISGAVVSWFLSRQLSIYIGQRLLARSQWGGQRAESQNSSSQQQDHLQTFQNQLKILVQVLLQRENSLLGRKNQYCYYWRLFNKRVFLHKLKCDQPKCICRSKKARRLQQLQQQIYLLDLFTRIQNVGAVLSKEARLKVLNIYILIEMARKPLKGYYQLISLKRDKTKMDLRLQIEDLVTKSRQCFDQIYYKNRVQNQQLELLKVIQSQQVLDALEEELKVALSQLVTFLEMFTYSSVKMTQVEVESKKLFKIKSEIEGKLEQMAWSSGDNGTVAFGVFVFYRLLQVYRSREAEFKKMGSQQVLKNRLQKAQGEGVTAQQGVIYIDLVQDRGRIRKLTKNLPAFFGYTREDMMGFNINLFMPTLFGKHHAKFLSNFIDKGRISLLKERTRSVFGRNKRKFIFPVSIKLKTEHLQQNQFGASAVLGCMDTSSEFMIIGKNGRIEQITEGLYRRIFERSLQDQVTKVSRLCGYKLLLSLNQVIEEWQQKDVNRIHEGLLLCVDREDYLMQKFRYSREVGYGSLPNRSKVLSSISAVSWSASMNQSISVSNDNAKSQRHQYLMELFRHFLIDINLSRLQAIKVSYKYSRVRTAQFEVQLIQVVSIREKLQGKEFVSQLLNELNNVAEIYQLLQEQSPVARHLLEMQYLIQDQSNMRRSSIQKSSEPRVEQPIHVSARSDYAPANDSEDQFLEQPQQKGTGNQVSEGSSLASTTENQSKKQLLINAFNSNQSALTPCVTTVAHCVLGLLLCLLALTTGFSFNYVNSVSVLWGDCSYLLYLRNTVEFRIGLAELNNFVINTNLTLPVDLQSSIGQLNEKMLSIVQQLNAKTTHNENDFNKLTWLYDPNRQLNYSASIPQMFSQILWLFQNNSSADWATLRYNYENIHKQLSSFYQLREFQLFYQNGFYLSLVTSFFAAYEVMLVLIAICSFPLYLYFKRQELNVRGKLAFMSMKEINKAITKIKLALQFLKIGNNQKGAIPRLQSELLDKRVEREEAVAVTRNIKISWQNQQSKVFLNPILYLLLFGFVVFFSHLPATVFTISQTCSDYFTGVVSANRLINQLEIKTPLLVNVYLSNINRVLSNESLWIFSNATIVETESGYFDLVNSLSSINSKDNAIVVGILSKATDPLRLFTGFILQNNISLAYLSNSLRNGFAYWSPSNGIKMNTSSIGTWIKEGNIQKMVDEIGGVLSISDVIRNQVSDEFGQYLNNMKLYLTILAAILIPLNFFMIVLISRKFIGLLNGIIKTSESIFMHFPVSVLIENTYLTSYFNSKTKHGK